MNFLQKTPFNLETPQFYPTVLEILHVLRCSQQPNSTTAKTKP